MKINGAAKHDDGREAIVFVTGPFLLALQRHVEACERLKDSLPRQVRTSYEALLPELSKPQFKVVKTTAIIEQFMKLPRIVSSNPDEGAI